MPAMKSVNSNQFMLKDKHLVYCKPILWTMSTLFIRDPVLQNINVQIYFKSKFKILD